MDVLDAGVYVSKWEAPLPDNVQTVLWGPLQAKEMGFEGWQCQDGGETGFVYHNPQVKLPAGFATSTLIVVNRLKRAYLTLYFGGYPANIKQQQRQMDARKVVSACELFLERLCKEKVTFELAAEAALVDNINDHAVDAGATVTMDRLPDGDAAIDAEARDPATQDRSKVWEV